MSFVINADQLKDFKQDYANRQETRILERTVAKMGSRPPALTGMRLPTMISTSQLIWQPVTSPIKTVGTLLAVCCFKHDASQHAEPFQSAG